MSFAWALITSFLLVFGTAGLAGAGGRSLRAGRRPAAGDREGRPGLRRLSNCTEARVLGTSPRDPRFRRRRARRRRGDRSGHRPARRRHRRRRARRRREEEIGTDPHDEDTDDDGEIDGEDDDPADSLGASIEGYATGAFCSGGSGFVTVLGIDIVLDADTEFEGADSCEEVAALVASDGMVHVETDVEGDLGTALVARRLELDDEDGDGSPDEVDEDDDDDGIPDDEEEEEELEDDEGEIEDGDDEDEDDQEEGDEEDEDDEGDTEDDDEDDEDEEDDD